MGLVDLNMEKLGMSKNELASKLGTSASFITQLFRGDRKPNWKILAKMSIALELDFKIVTEDSLKEKFKEETMARPRRSSNVKIKATS